MLIDFSAAFDMVNHQGILYRLCSVGIRGSQKLSISTHFLSNRSQNVIVWMVVGVIWLTLCLQCCKAVFWARY